jgi:hypothetical protein
MKSKTTHYPLKYDPIDSLGFETLVQLPNGLYCTFYSFKRISDLLLNNVGWKAPKVIGYTFRRDMSKFEIEAFIYLIRPYE